ncbi:MAG: HIT family protein [Gammaproteobacteria bacterium]|nr:HIT family protein [Gammaproteobacteria bacterium]
MTNETILKFNYPESLIREYDHWVVLLRPAQVTVGSLVLASREEALRFPDLSRDGFTELRIVAGDLESALSEAFQYEKINYLMLMMVDKYVHYHVIPRYSAPVRVGDGEYTDESWPGPPDVTRALDLPGGALAAIQGRITAAWPG